ncbi:uncharacterized protein LOC111465352 isoform X1 [Cucurbita maxima]|uniref:Uncharacterized protein LOC111465352 isoform X1 n=1 Tax=Cucurbita maxima TaxID=3661 RepID=A0A6J1HNY9_CUCMA|nr:uncharacterized protein LOC111465352 isoform X1 [Cucurbita maxima]
MGCFLACFGDCKRRKQPRKSSVEIPSSNHVFKASDGVCALEKTKEVAEVPPIDLIKDSLEKLEEQIELCHATEKASEPIIEDNKVVPSKENESKLDEIKDEKKSGKEEDESWGSSNLSQAFTLSLNHRYENCSNSDDNDEYAEEMDHLDEKEEEKRKDDTNADDGHGESMLLMEQESSESLFSLSFGSRKQVCGVEDAENEVSSLDLSHQQENASSEKKTGCWNKNVVGSVLKPIENDTRCLSHQPNNASSEKKTGCWNENVVGSVLNPIENDTRCLSHQPDNASSKKNTGRRNENVVGSVLNPIENVTHCLSHTPANASSEKNMGRWNENVVGSVLNPIENVTHCLSHQPENASPNKKTDVENVTRCLSQQPENASSDKKTDVGSVLNPIENVTTHCLSAAKVKALPSDHHLEKENISLDKGCDVLLISPEPTFRAMRKLKENCSDKHVEDEIAVDTSLSNWLVESETTPKSNSTSSSIGNSPMWTRNSAKSNEDRPILGALTLEEIRQFSAFSTPRRSRSRSPEETPIIGTVGSYWSPTKQDVELRQFSAFSTPRRLRSRSPEETPIIGTVGSYWSHTGQDADSNPGSLCKGPRKSREDERVNWNSTPFLERLDMALASNSAEV